MAEKINYDYLYDYAQERLQFYLDAKLPGDIPPIITNKFDFHRLLKRWRKRKKFAYDTETNSLRYYREAQLVGISVSWGRTNTYYIPVGHITDDAEQLPISYVIKKLKPIFEASNITIIGHNLKFDAHIFANYGINVLRRIFDTQVAAHRYDENQDIGLKALSYKILGIKQMEFNTLVNAGIDKDFKKSMGLKGNQKGTIDMVSPIIAGPYALDDAYCTWMLYNHFKPILVQEGLWEYFQRKDMQFLRNLYAMERVGISVDKKKLKVLDKKITEGISDLACDIYKAVGYEFKITSSAQLGKVLFSDLGFSPIGYTKGGKTKAPQPCVDKDTLEQLSLKFYKSKKMQRNLDILDKIRDYLKLTRHKTFIQKFQELVYSDGKIHASFNQTGTVTGRLSCNEPNLQQIPKAGDESDIRHQYNLREVFIVNDPGYCMVGVDESNLELRILAHFSDDPNLKDAFFKGQDVHGRTALQMFDLKIPKGHEEDEDAKLKWVKKYYEGLRDVGKTLNFGLIYGLQVENFSGKVSRTLKREVTVQEGQSYYDKYFEKLPGVNKFIKSTKQFAHKNGFVYTISGRKRQLHDINSSRGYMRARAERQAVNSMIQGSAADVIKEAQIGIMGDPLCRRWGVEALLQVHDELVFRVKKKYAKVAIERIRHFMELPFGEPLDVPLEADPESGYSWYEVK